MHPQLEAVAEEFTSAQVRLHALDASLPDEWWDRRADATTWSVAECVAHLNLTAEAYLPPVRRGIEEARSIGGGPPNRFRRDPVGWILWRTAGPPVRLCVRTPAPFIPAAAGPRAHTLETFDRLQEEQLRCVREADGLPLSRVRITSPFDARLRYSLYSCLTLLPRHQHRHIWQAGRVLERLRRGR